MNANPWRQALLRAAKYIDETVTEDDTLLHALEDAYAGGSPTQLADAALNIVHRAETITWGGGH